MWSLHLGPVNIILPPIENTSSVTVDAVPGAVNVFAIAGWNQGGADRVGYVDPLVRHVGLTRLLTPKDVVYAEQWLCSESTPGIGMRTVHAQRSTLHPRAPQSRLSTRRRSQAGRPAHSKLQHSRHNGFYQFTAFVENQETGAELLVDVQLSLWVSAVRNCRRGSQCKKTAREAGTQGCSRPATRLLDQNTFDGFMNPTLGGGPRRNRDIRD